MYTGLYFEKSLMHNIYYSLSSVDKVQLSCHSILYLRETVESPSYFASQEFSIVVILLCIG